MEFNTLDDLDMMTHAQLVTYIQQKEAMHQLVTNKLIQERNYWKSQYWQLSEQKQKQTLWNKISMAAWRTKNKCSFRIRRTRHFIMRLVYE